MGRRGKRCGGLWSNRHLMCIKIQSVIVGFGAIFRNCGGKGRMGVMNKVGVITTW
jgi:hypothetical protein